ncbi:MAG: preprotein translocase subunit YajC [Planctomycetes bacterium]|nr:preprotein translocase subunit YajC [Planctomycetota bacterium]
MPQPIHPISLPTPLSPTFFVALPFAHPRHGMQEPKTAPDTPSGVAPVGPAPQGGGGAQVPDPNKQVPPAGPCGMEPNMILFLGLGLVLMYFLVMRPENKRRKEQQAMLAAVKVGDHVVTLGGMHGTVASLTEKTLTLRVDTVKVVIDRTAIARVERDDAPGGTGKSN